MLKQLNQLSFFSLLVIINLQKQDFENGSISQFEPRLEQDWFCDVLCEIVLCILCFGPDRCQQLITIDAGLRSIESIESMESGKGMDLEVANLHVKNCEKL